MQKLPSIPVPWQPTLPLAFISSSRSWRLFPSICIRACNTLSASMGLRLPSRALTWTQILKHFILICNTVRAEVDEVDCQAAAGSRHTQSICHLLREGKGGSCLCHTHTHTHQAATSAWHLICLKVKWVWHESDESGNERGSECGDRQRGVCVMASQVQTCLFEFWSNYAAHSLHTLKNV